MTPGLQTCFDALDCEYGRDWHTRIDLDYLNMRSFDNCILGQLHELRPGEWNAITKRLVGHHIDGDGGKTPFAYFAGFDDEWKDAIYARLETGSTL